jgi:hypothetical protein
MLGKRAREFLAGNKVGSYLPYAFGDIVLLIVGILVALQIDNWNERRKESILEAQYYCRLYESALQDRIQINRLQTEMQSRLSASIDMMAELQDEDPDRSSVANKMLAAIRLSGEIFHPDTSAFEDIKSSGNLNVLEDTEVKDQTSKYYSNVIAISMNHSANSDHMLARFFDHADSIGAGWLNLEFLKTTLDGTAVDIESLVKQYPLTEEIAVQLMNDALVYVAINARGADHVQSILNHIIDITRVLETKCDDTI